LPQLSSVLLTQDGGWKTEGILVLGRSKYACIAGWLKVRLLIFDKNFQHYSLVGEERRH